MSSQAFLWVNIVIAVVLIALFFIGRKGQKPSKLNLRAGRKSGASGGLKEKGLSTEFASQVPGDFQVRSKFQGPEEDRVKNLNVMFMYNGHNFDAYEVLGLPAGAKMDQVKKAYEALAAQSDPSSKEFIETAFKAIIHDQRS